MKYPAKTRPLLSAAVILIASLIVLAGLAILQSRATTRANSDLAYKLHDGDYNFDTVDRTLRDPKRNKDLPIRILVPKSGGPFPLIVFSHGAGGSGQNYFALTGFWASHGYVVIQPTHNDSIALRREKGEDLPNGPRELINEYRFNYEDWINRVRDVTLVLDSIGELEKLTQLKEKIDHKRIGVGGHSYGAFTTQMIGGARVDIPDGRKAQSFSDDRPRALMLLSPQGEDQNGLTAASWNDMTRPTMSMTGSNDTGIGGVLASWREDPYNYSPPGDKYLVFIDGAFHMSFTGMLAQVHSGQSSRPVVSALTGRTDQKAVFDYVKIASIAFWDAYLKDDAKARAYLKSDSLASYSKNAVTVDRK